MNLNTADRRIINALYIIATAIGVWLWLCASEPTYDDLVYMHECHGHDMWSCGGPAITDIAQIPASIRVHFGLFNSRLANAVAYFVLLLPRQVSAAICALMAAAMLAALIRLAAASGRRTWIAPLTVFLIWAALPWSDCMTSVDYLINYVWASAMALWMLVFADKIEHPGRAATAGIFIAGILTGWMHEGIIAGAIAYAAVRAMQTRSRAWLYTLIALSIGMMINVCGATLLRVGRLKYYFTMAEVCRAAIPQCFTLVVALPLALLAARKVGLRKAAEEFIAPLAMVVAGIAVCMAVRQLTRTAWTIQLGSIILFVRSLVLLSRPESDRRWLAVHAGALVVYTAWLTSLISWQERFSDEERALISMNRTDSDTVYMPLTLPQDAPWYLANIAHHWFLGKGENYMWARHYLDKDCLIIKPLTGRQILIADTAATVPVRLEVGPVNGSTQPIDFIMALATGRTGPATIEVQAEASNVPGLYYLASPGRIYRSRCIISATPVKSEN